MIKNKWVRILIPSVLIIIWLILASIGGPTFGKLNNVSQNSQAAFLPSSADSTKVANLESKFSGESELPAIVIISSPTPFTPSDFIHYAPLKVKLSEINGVDSSPGSVIGPIPSKDHLALEYIVQVKNIKNIDTVVSDMRTILNNNLVSGDKAYVTGPGGLSADLFSAFNGIDGILLIVAVIAVFVILLVVYRSFILPFLVLITAMFALCAAILLVYILAKNNVIKLNGQSQGILSILVIGATTDYSLLIISRFKEALHHTESKWDAIIRAFRAVIEPIGATASTVILALLCLVFSDLNSNKSLGPIAALGIVFSFLSSLTLLTSFLVLFGRKAFWPIEPHFDENTKNSTFVISKLWTNIAKFIGRKPRIIWVTCVIVLLISSLGLTQLKANGVSTSDSILGASNAVAGQKVLASHFPAGSGSPTEIIVNKDQAAEALALVKATPGLVSPTFQLSNSSHASKVIEYNGQVQINVTLVATADSSSAQHTISKLRQDFKDNNVNALVGGITAINLDTNKTATADIHKIIPLVLVVIFIILMLLLRSVLAPVLLIFSVMLSFAGSLGISALVFNHIFKFAGSDPSVPLFAFIFLVALGVDYNIFLMTRVREESLKIGTKLGILKGLAITGSVITSAGIVLAATFAALSVIPILFLVQIAFIVAFGVLVDTIIVRTLLVPALCYDIGKPIWWPSKLWKKGKA